MAGVAAYGADDGVRASEAPEGAEPVDARLHNLGSSRLAIQVEGLRGSRCRHHRHPALASSMAAVCVSPKRVPERTASRETTPHFTRRVHRINHKIDIGRLVGWQYIAREKSCLPSRRALTLVFQQKSLYHFGRWEDGTYTCLQQGWNELLQRSHCKAWTRTAQLADSEP